MGAGKKVKTPIVAFEIRETARQLVEVGLALANKWFELAFPSLMTLKH